MNFNSMRISPIKINPIQDDHGSVKTIEVTRNRKTTLYHRTNRGIDSLANSVSSFSSLLNLISDRTTLDLGCGDGKLVQDLCSLGQPILGVDLYLTDSQKKDPRFLEGDAFSLPFKTQSFELLISSFSVFHYEPVSSIPGLCREVHRLSTKDGMLCVPSLENNLRRETLTKTLSSFGWNVLLDPTTKTVLAFRR